MSVTLTYDAGGVLIHRLVCGVGLARRFPGVADPARPRVSRPGSS
jgi:hypothetical protein